MATEFRKLAKYAYLDSGPVQGRSNYTTLVLIHGIGWHSEAFRHMLPMAEQNNIRLVLLNRRGYPHSDPFTAEEEVPLASAKSAAPGEVLPLLEKFMDDRAHEIFVFLCAFIKQEQIPEKHGQDGGIILCTWSLAATWLTAFLANIASFEGDVDLLRYVRYTVLYDPPYNTLGYPKPSDPYHPLEDENIPPENRLKAFVEWLSSYYTHGPTEGTLERRTRDAEPPPTPVDFDEALVDPNGADFTLLVYGNSSNLNGQLRRRAFYLAPDASPATKNWFEVPCRYLMCERSVWEMPWCSICLSNEVQEAKKGGIHMRDISVRRLPGANHFAHTDNPRKLLQALLPDGLELL